MMSGNVKHEKAYRSGYVVDARQIKHSRGNKNDDGVESNIPSPLSILSGTDWNNSPSKVVLNFYAP